MTAEIRRIGAVDAALLDRVAEEVFDAPIEPVGLAAYLAEAEAFVMYAYGLDAT